MAVTFPSLRALYAHGYDDVIDVRSPAEFAEDRIPGAINLPVLDNEERAIVGTIYKQENRFKARRIGAALVLKNIHIHLDTALADRPAAWRPLVYCWRGGQRSGTFTWLMREIGWRADALDGGYRTYRRMVAATLHDTALPWRPVVLAGMTCTAKTALLDELTELGVQVLDLEGLARHRGSVFGGMADPQPAQKDFESRVAGVLARFDPARPVVVEAESSKIGDLLVPPSLWSAMLGAPRIAVSAPLEARAAFFMRAYADLVAEPERFCAILDQLIRLQGHEKVETWQEMVRGGQMQAVAAALMADHYDPRYTRSMARHGDRPVAVLEMDTLEPQALAASAPRLVEMITAADQSANQGAASL